MDREGWTTEQMPNGTYLHKPVSLPHNRHPSAMFVVKLWVVIGFSLIFLLFAMAWYIA